MTDDRLRRSDRVVSRACDEGVILLQLDEGGYYMLDEIGGQVWDACDGSRSLGSIIAALADEYDASAALIRADVEELVHELVGERLLVQAA